MEDQDLNPAWRAALERFRRDLEARGASQNTLRAYDNDLLELALWAHARDREPGALVYRDLRTYAAALSERGLAKSSVARKLTAVRSFHQQLVRRGEAGQNPAELLPTPKRESRLPTVLGPGEVASLLDRIPATSPLEIRDRAIFELAYSCGLRADEIVNLDLGDADFDAETLRVSGKGSKTRLVPIGEPAQRALDRYLDHGRRALAEGGSGRRTGAVPVAAGTSARHLGHPAPACALGPAGRARRADLPPYAAPLVRDPPARGRRRPALDPGAARARQRLDDAGLHPGRAEPAAARVLPLPPPRVSEQVVIAGGEQPPSARARLTFGVA